MPGLEKKVRPLAQSPLIKELQQGRKMQSLDTLMMKLDEDQTRHAVHVSSVQQGRSKVASAQEVVAEVGTKSEKQVDDGKIVEEPEHADQAAEPVSPVILTPTPPLDPRTKAAPPSRHRMLTEASSPEGANGKAEEAPAGAEGAALPAVTAPAPAAPASPPSPASPPKAAPPPASPAKASPAPKAKGSSMLGLSPQRGTLSTPQMSLASCGTVKFTPPKAPIVDTAEEESSTQGIDKTVTTANGASTESSPEKEKDKENLAVPQRDGSRRPSNASVIAMGGATGTEGFKMKVKVASALMALSSDEPSGKLEQTSLTKRLGSKTRCLGIDLHSWKFDLDKKRKEKLLLHGDDVLGLSFGPQGTTIVAAGETAQVVIWDIEQGTRKMEVAMGGAITAVAYAPNGHQIAAADADSFITVWLVESQEEVGCTDVNGGVMCLAMLSHPNELLAVGTTSKNVMLLSIPDMEEIADLRHDGHVHSISFSPDGGMLAGAGGTDDMHGLMTKKGKDREMKTVIWNVSADREHCKYLGAISFEDIVHATAFSPTGKLLAVGGENCAIALLLVEREFEKASELVCPAGVRCLAWTSNSRFLASAGEDLQVSVWDPIEERVVLRLPKTEDWVCAVAFSCDNKWLAQCGFGCSAVTLYPVKAAKVERKAAPKQAADDEVYEPRSEDEDEESDVSADDVPAFSLSVDTVEKTESLKPQTADDASKGNSQSTPATTAAPSAVPVTKGNSTVLALPKSSVRRQSSASVVELGEETQGFQCTVKQVAIKADGVKVDLVQRIAAKRSAAAKILGIKLSPTRMIRSESREKVRLEHTDEVVSMMLSADGLTLVAGGEDCMIILWDLTTREKRVEVKMGSAVSAIAYAPTGQYFAGGDVESEVGVWDMEGNAVGDGNSVSVEGDVLTLAITSEPQELLAVGTTAKKVMLLSIPDLEDLADLRHDGHVRSVSFSPAGGILAGGGGTDDMHGLMTKKNHKCQMKTVIWRIDADGDSCKYLGSILFDDIVHATSFSPSGKLLAVGGENCMVALLLVDRDFEKASELPCTAGVRCLAWSSDSRFLASAGEDLKVSVWDILGENVVFTLPKVEDWLCSVAFTKDSRWLCSCGYGDQAVTLHPIDVELDTEGRSSVWESQGSNVDDSPTNAGRSSSKDQQPVVHIGVDSHSASAGAQSRGMSLMTPTNGSMFMSCGTVKYDAAQKAKPKENAANTIQIPGPELKRRPSRVVNMENTTGFQLHVEQWKDKDDVSGTASTNTKMSKTALLLGVKQSSAEMRLSDSREKIVLQHEDEVLSLSFNPDGTRILSGGEDACLVVWDVQKPGTRIMDIKQDSAIIALDYGPNGTFIAAATTNKTVKAWRAATQEEIGSEQVEGDILSVALGAQTTCDLLAVGTTEKKVLLFSLPEMVEIADLRHDGHVHSLSFSMDGVMLAGGGGTDDMHGLMTNKAQDRNMKTVVWQVSSNDENCEFLGSIGFTDIVHATAFSPTGKMLAAGGENRMIALLLVDRDFDKASELSSTAGVRCLSWSACSRFLASGGEDMQISVWNVLNEQVIFQLPKAEDWYCSVSFSSDSLWLAACGYGMTSPTLYPLELDEPSPYCSEIDGGDREVQEDAADADDSQDAGGFSVTVASSNRLPQETGGAKRASLVGSRPSLATPGRGDLAKSAGTVKFSRSSVAHTSTNGHLPSPKASSKLARASVA